MEKINSDFTDFSVIRPFFSLFHQSFQPRKKQEGENRGIKTLECMLSFSNLDISSRVIKIALLCFDLAVDADISH